MNTKESKFRLTINLATTVLPACWIWRKETARSSDFVRFSQARPWGVGLWLISHQSVTEAWFPLDIHRFACLHTRAPYLLLSSTGEAVFSPSWKDLAQKLKDSTVTQFLVPPLLLGSNEPKSKFNEPKSTTWGFANLPQLIVANDSSWKGTCDDNSVCRNDQSSAWSHCARQ